MRRVDPEELTDRDLRVLRLGVERLLGSDALLTVTDRHVEALRSGDRFARDELAEHITVLCRSLHGPDCDRCTQEER